MCRPDITFDIGVFNRALILDLLLKDIPLFLTNQTTLQALCYIKFFFCKGLSLIGGICPSLDYDLGQFYNNTVSTNPNLAATDGRSFEFLISIGSTMWTFALLFSSCYAYNKVHNSYDYEAYFVDLGQLIKQLYSQFFSFSVSKSEIIKTLHAKSFSKHGSLYLVKQSLASVGQQAVARHKRKRSQSQSACRKFNRRRKLEGC